MNQRRWWIAALAIPLCVSFASADEPARKVPVRCQDGIPLLSKIPILGVLFTPAPTRNPQGLAVPAPFSCYSEEVVSGPQPPTMAPAPSPIQCVGFVDCGTVCAPPVAAVPGPPPTRHGFTMARPGPQERIYQIEARVFEGESVVCCPKMMTVEGEPARVAIVQRSEDGKSQTEFRLHTHIGRDAGGSLRLNLRAEQTSYKEKGEGKTVESTSAVNVTRKVRDGKKVRIPWERLPGDRETTCIELTVNELQQPAPAPRMVEAATVAPCEIRAVCPPPAPATQALIPVGHCQPPIARCSEPAKGMIFQVKKEKDPVTEKEMKVLEVISPNGGRVTCEAIEVKLRDEVETRVKIAIRNDQVFITEGDCGGIGVQIHRVEACADRVTMDHKSGELVLTGKVRVKNRQGCDVESPSGNVRVSFGCCQQTGVISSPQLAQ